MSEELGRPVSEEPGRVLSEELRGTVSEELGGTVLELDRNIFEELGRTPSEELGGTLTDVERSARVVEGDRASDSSVSATDALVVVGDKVSAASVDVTLSVSDVEGCVDRVRFSPKGFPRPGAYAGQSAHSFRYKLPVFVV